MNNYRNNSGNVNFTNRNGKVYANVDGNQYEVKTKDISGRLKGINKGDYLTSAVISTATSIVNSFSAIEGSIDSVQAAVDAERARVMQELEEERKKEEEQNNNE